MFYEYDFVKEKTIIIEKLMIKKWHLFCSKNLQFLGGMMFPLQMIIKVHGHTFGYGGLTIIV